MLKYLGEKRPPYIWSATPKKCSVLFPKIRPHFVRIWPSKGFSEKTCYSIPNLRFLDKMGIFFKF